MLPPDCGAGRFDGGFSGCPVRCAQILAYMRGIGREDRGKNYKKILFP